MIHLAIFLSGGGSNARHICQYFDGHPNIRVALLLSNKEKSGAKAISADFAVPFFIFDKSDFKETDIVLNKLKESHIDAIILAGFLWLIPKNILENFTNKIINIHPALLPKFGGKGMHGMHVHQAVLENEETESGITIHLCNEKYDEGQILFQEKVKLNSTETAETIAQKVLALEHQYFAPTIEQYLLRNEK